MANYVDKESLIKYVDNAMTLLVADQPDDKLKEFYLMVKGFALDYISIAPTVDVKPVVRGEWRFSPDDSEGICTVCQHKIYGRPYQNTYLIVPYNFCPNCGADMRGDNDD